MIFNQKCPNNPKCPDTPKCFNTNTAAVFFISSEHHSEAKDRDLDLTYAR